MIQRRACWHPSREERRLNSNQSSSIHLFFLATAVRDPCHQRDISGKGQPAAEPPILTASEIVILERFLISPAALSQWPFQHVPLQGWVSGHLLCAGTASLPPSALLQGCINHGHHPAGQRMPAARDLHHHLRFWLPKSWQSPDARAHDC